MGPFQGGEFWLDEKVVIRWAFQLTTNQIRVSRVTIHNDKTYVLPVVVGTQYATTAVITGM